MIETIINKNNLEDNKYKHVGNFADLEIHAKDNHRLLLERVQSIDGFYKIYGNFLTNKEKSLRVNKLYVGLQLDLFYNMSPFNNTKEVKDYIIGLNTLL